MVHSLQQCRDSFLRWYAPELNLSLSFFTLFRIMALYSQATDLQTRSIIWVSTNVVKNRPQYNSHNNNTDEDGASAVDLASRHTDYQGWQSTTHQFYCNPEAARISFFV